MEARMEKTNEVASTINKNEKYKHWQDRHRLIPAKHWHNQNAIHPRNLSHTKDHAPFRLKVVCICIHSKLVR
jgi:hypothetical protein